MSIKARLKQLGYLPYTETDIIWLKRINNFCTLRIIINGEKIFDAMVEQNAFVRKKEEIKELEKSFELLEKDLEKLL